MNSVRAASPVVLKALLAMVCLAAAATVGAADCKQLFRAAHVLRVDEAAKRLFVTSTEEQLESRTGRARLARELRHALTTCRPEWKSDWNISFFLRADFAGYKDDDRLRGPVESGEWAAAYLGEFRNSTAVLTLFPAVPTRKKDVLVRSK